MAFPSAGCQTCKTRRIKSKCDEAKPTCQRCRKSRRTCLRIGPKQARFFVHLENEYASGETKRPRGPRSSARPHSPGDVGPLLPHHPSFDLQDRAMLHYLDDHLRTRTQRLSLSDGLMESVSAWMTRAKCPMVDLAISSMALAVYARTQQYPPAATEASAKYQKLLQLTQSTIPSLNAANIDSCLLAIFLMSRYEGVVHRPESGLPIVASLSVFSHHDGAMAVLKNWRSRLRPSQPATDIIKHSRRGLIKSAILRSNSIPEWMQDGVVFGEEGLQLEYDGIIVRLLALRNELFTIARIETDQEVIPEILLSKAELLDIRTQSLEHDLETWISHLPTSSSYVSHTIPLTTDLPTSHFFSDQVYNYLNINSALLWNQYFWTRMLLLSTRLRLFRLISRLNPVTSLFIQSQEVSLSASLHTTSLQLASSIPFCLDKIKLSDDGESIELKKYEVVKGYTASLVVWPLSVASSLNGLEKPLKSWFRSELGLLGKVIGAKVLECAGEGEEPWLEI